MSEEKPFGLQLYEGLKEHGRLELLTALLNYAGIQQLKQADRDEVLKMFHGHPYAFLQRLKKDTPAEIVDQIVRRAEMAAAAGQQVVPFLILAGL